MTNFFVNLELSATYTSALPTLEILVDGEVVSSGQISARTGSGTTSLGFTLSSSSANLSSLSFRFADSSSEANRNIRIEAIKVNNVELPTSTFLLGGGATVDNGAAVITQNNSLGINVNAIDYILGEADATLADLGTVTMQGTAAAEKLVGGKNSAVIDGGAGNDEIRAGQEADNVYGGEGNDRIYGNDGDDFILGGGGDDRIWGRNDHDLIYGGDGNDNLNGGEGNDVLNGGNGTDRLYGENGNDILEGGAGNDLLYGQNGNDIASGGDGNDRLLSGAGDDVLYGGAGDDRLFAEGGSNILNGDAGADVLIADNDSDQDTLNGGDDNDILQGASNADILNGDGGNDRIEGHDGDDIIDGGEGDDLIFGMVGNDQINGGAGHDDIEGGDGNDEIYGDDGNDKIEGDAGADEIHGGEGIDTIRGGTGNDTIYGDAGNDRLFGEDGNDILEGGLGNDLLRGHAGNDIINGGDGNDTIVHDDNADIINGGAGFDTLRLSNTYTLDINVTAGDLQAVNIERLALNNYDGVVQANSLTISIADIASLSGADTLYITGDVGFDTVTVNGLDVGADFVATITANGTTYDHYQQGANNLFVENGLTVFAGSAPLAQDDNFAGTEEVNITGNLLADNGNGVDVDPEGGSLSALAQTIATASGGTVTIAANGDFTYTPLSNFYGEDTFFYTLQNGLGETDTGLVTLTLANDNDGPTAQDDSFVGITNTVLSGNLLGDNGNGDDTDVEDNGLGAVAETITSASGATVVINADGAFTYTPSTGYIGPDSFNYTLIDGDGGTDVASVDILVQDVNGLPAGDISLNVGSTTGAVGGSQLNNGGPFDEKTTILAFETGADVNTRQVLYKQGGGTRGMNIYIENGELHMAVWNLAEENWGFREVTTSISANQEYSAAFVLDGALPSNGIIQGFLDGASFGTNTGVGLLYDHAGASVGESNNSIRYSGNVNAGGANPFQGTIEGVVQYNEVLSLTDIETVSTNITLPTAVFVIDDVQQATAPNDAAINEGGPYAEKTMSVAFVAGSDVTSRQVIYEQGGTVRGLSIFIEGGQLHVAAWNFAEENWGFKEVTTAINADEFYTATLMLEGVQNETGTLTGFINGISFGVATDVGLLYNHPGAIGVGEQVSGAYYSDGADGGNGVYGFTGTIERLAQYNEALQGQDLIDLHSAQASQNPGVTDNTTVGDAGDNVIGGGNGNDNIQGRDGNDSISGNAGNDTLRGENDNDTLYGNSGDDILYGGAGDDILVGGTGLDVLYGDSGADIFGFLQTDGNIDQIRDFELGTDVINITNILTGFTVGVDDISDYVIVNVVNAGRTDIRVDIDGAASGASSQVLAIVRGSDFGVSSAQDLLDNGTLIVDQSLI